MEAIFQRAKTALLEFVSQRESPMLVIDGGPAELTLALKLLESIEQNETNDVHWMFPFDFISARQYVEACVQAVNALVEVGNAALHEAGEPTVDGVPADVLGGGVAPAERMRRLMAYTRDMIEDPDDCHTVIGIVPFSIKDAVAYSAFVGAVAAHRLPNPWCRGMRLIVRDEPVHKPLARTLGKAPRIRWLHLELGQEAVSKSLEERAFDEDKPLSERMEALTMSATMDYSHGRLEDAMSKYGLCERYYANQGNALMHALALQGIGDTFLRGKQRKNAKSYLERALKLSTAELLFPVMLQSAYSLGSLSREEKRFDDAISYYDSAAKLGLELRATDIYLLSMLYRGECELDKGDFKAAGVTWMQGEAFAADVEAHVLREQILLRQKNLFAKYRLKDRLRDVEQKLAKTRASIQADRSQHSHAHGAVA